VHAQAKVQKNLHGLFTLLQQNNTTVRLASTPLWHYTAIELATVVKQKQYVISSSL
jgi:hypothetical protein